MLKHAAYPTALLASLILVACGGSGPDIPSKTPSTPPSNTSPAAPDTTPSEPEPSAPAPEAEAPAPESTSPTTTSPVVEAVAASHLYVATNGSDSNPGTQARPFKTILKASQVAKPGTIVHVAPGVYPGSFTTAKNGTSSARIRYVSDKKWGAKIVPPANSGLVAGWYNTGDYVDISGFEIDGTKTQGGRRWSLGLLNRGSYVTVENNHVHHIATSSDFCNSTGGSALNADTLQDGYHVNFIGNVVHHIGVPGCNKIHGIYLSTSGTIKNNLVYQVGYGGIHLWHDASNIDITNNTVFATQYGIMVGGGDFYKSKTKKADYVNVTNNIVYDNSTGIIEIGAFGTNNKYVNNLVYKNSRVNFALRNPQTGSVVADPQFVSYNRNGGGDYRLKSTSPAIGYGSPTYAPKTDIVGTARPQGGRHDIGAYEYVGAGAR